MSSLEARELFQKGSGLCFDDANQFSPLLEEWPEAIRADLGLSALTFSRSLIYATKEGRGTDPHFDQNINFVIQISGTKKWWVAPNEHVDNPLTRHTMGVEMDPELSSYAREEMPEKFPDNGIEFILKPGSVLFVPRGSWHRTEATSDALSLNFTFTAPCWIDLFVTALRGRLLQSPNWRETADFVTDEELNIKAKKNWTLYSLISCKMPQAGKQKILSMRSRWVDLLMKVSRKRTSFWDLVDFLKILKTRVFII